MAERVAERVAQHWDMAKCWRERSGSWQYDYQGVVRAMRVLTKHRAPVVAPTCARMNSEMPRAANASLRRQQVNERSPAGYFSAVHQTASSALLCNPQHNQLCSRAFVRSSERRAFHCDSQ